MYRVLGSQLNREASVLKLKWEPNGEVRVRLALRGIGGFKSISEYVLPLSWSEAEVLVTHRWPLGLAQDKLRFLSDSGKQEHWKLVFTFTCSWFHALSGYPSGVHPSILEIRPDAKVHVSGWRRACPDTKWWVEKRETRGPGWAGAAIESPGWFLAPGRYMVHMDANHWMVVQAGEACHWAF